MKETKKKWVVLAAGVCIQIVLGGVYAWSTFTPYLLDGYGLSKGQNGLIFGTTIISFTAVMIAAGRVLNRRGPRLTALIGALLFLLGYLLSSWTKGSFPLLVLSIGVMSGAGIGFGYVCPLSAGMKWFPRQKGLVTGVAVAGFGGGAVLLTAAANILLPRMDILDFFRWYGISAGALLFAASLLLSFPEDHDTEKQTRPAIALTTPAFFLSAAGLFAGTFAGLMVIGNLSLILETAGHAITVVAVSIAVFAGGNALGRICWGIFYDRLKELAMPLSLVNMALPALLLLVPLSPPVLYTAILLLGFGFGSNFVVYAGVISDYYGIQAFSSVYPISFLAYGLAGLIGPGAGGMIADRTGSFTAAIAFSVAMLGAAALALYINRRVFQSPSIAATTYSAYK
ncbi:MAG: MFS transporter [Spirochaetales bacterium]|nr:MFS transporter [Spirochaetales bacterium]